MVGSVHCRAIPTGRPPGVGMLALERVMVGLDGQRLWEAGFDKPCEMQVFTE